MHVTEMMSLCLPNCCTHTRRVSGVNHAVQKRGEEQARKHVAPTMKKGARGVNVRKPVCSKLCLENGQGPHKNHKANPKQTARASFQTDNKDVMTTLCMFTGVVYYCQQPFLWMDSLCNRRHASMARRENKQGKVPIKQAAKRAATVGM